MIFQRNAGAHWFDDYPEARRYLPQRQPELHAIQPMSTC
jgi:hypothetical protein